MRTIRTEVPPQEVEINYPGQVVETVVNWKFVVSEREASVAFYPMILGVEVKILDEHEEVQHYKLEGDWDLSERTANADYFPKRIEADLSNHKATLYFN